MVILLASHGHIRHGLVSLCQDIITVVLIVLRVGQREVRSELDAIRHKVVQSQTRRETIEALFDDRTDFVVIRTRHTESSLFTTTGDVHTVVMHLTDLGYFFHPIRVLIIVGIISRAVGEIHQFDDARSGVTLTGVEVSFLQHHGVAGTVEHVQTLRLPSAREAVVKTDTGLTAATTARGDFDHTIRAACTPDGRCGSILQHLDAGDIVGRHLQERGKLFLVVQVGEIHRRQILSFEGITVHHDQRFLRTVDGVHTAQAHRGTGTEVTGVRHDIQTCDFTLQRFTGSREGKTFFAVHVQRLRRGRNFAFGNHHTV